MSGEGEGFIDERQMAAEERQSAAKERQTAADERRHARTDVAALAVEVGHLGASVQDLHDLILDSMIKSEQAIVKAGQAPSKWRVYTLVGGAVLLSLGLAAGGYFTVMAMRDSGRQLRQIQYDNCLARNDSQAASDAYLIELNKAVERARERGDVLAEELGGLLVPRVDRLALPNCSLLLR